MGTARLDVVGLSIGIGRPKVPQANLQTGKCGPVSETSDVGQRRSVGQLARVGLVCWEVAHRQSVVSGIRRMCAGQRAGEEHLT